MRTLSPKKARKFFGRLVFGIAIMLAAKALPVTAAEHIHKEFVVLPYIQLGNNPTYGKLDKLKLLWVSKDDKADWSVEVKRDGKEWLKAQGLRHRQIDKGAGGADSLFDCALNKLPVNKSFEY